MDDFKSGHTNDNNENSKENLEFTVQENQKKKKNDKMNVSYELFDWLQAIVVAVVITMALRTFVFTLVNVSGQSMEPTLHDHDRMVVVRLNYVPAVGDIIIFKPEMHQDQHYVKRVIATSGQTVDIDVKRGVVIVDGKELSEDYTKDITRTIGNVAFPVTVPPEHVFAMGDNRNNSRDSRFSDVGMISLDSIVGKAVYRFWPVEDLGAVH